MTDFMDGLEADLVEAARRENDAGRAAASSRRRRVTGRGLALGLATLVLAGSATAAVVGLTAEPSKPLAGPVRDGAPSARTYAVSLLPDWRAGQAGWCAQLRVVRGGGSIGTGTGCGPARAAGGSQIVAGGAIGDLQSIKYAVVTARTRAVRFDERTLVATRRDPSLPYGWRYAVALVDTPAAERPSAVGIMPTPGGPSAATRTTRAPATSHPKPPKPFMPVQYDAQGNELPATTRADDHSRQGRSRRVTEARPARRCVIGGAEGYVAGYARVQTSRPKSAPRIEGRAFGSCAYTVFHPKHKPGGLTAAILLDSHHPRARAAALPRTPGLSGRRLGPGWIVVYGGSAADRQRLLERLRPRL